LFFYKIFVGKCTGDIFAGFVRVLDEIMVRELHVERDKIKDDEVRIVQILLSM
jgi:hypothetical protein